MALIGRMDPTLETAHHHLIKEHLQLTLSHGALYLPYIFTYVSRNVGSEPFLEL